MAGVIAPVVGEISPSDIQWNMPFMPTASTARWSGTSEFKWGRRPGYRFTLTGAWLRPNPRDRRHRDRLLETAPCATMYRNVNDT